MATAILRRNPNPRCLSDPDRGRPRRRKRSPESIGARPASKSLVMGQVKILKRGEPLTAFAAARHGSPGLAAAAAKGRSRKEIPTSCWGLPTGSGPTRRPCSGRSGSGSCPASTRVRGCASRPRRRVPSPCRASWARTTWRRAV
ncbi:hypothetical protein NL676_033083 [Syzygium grande]|nr:hypothetical protein NL676_033083 [Syzygium grande]